MRITYQPPTILWILAGLGFFSVGCGKQSFDVVKSQKIVEAPGILSIRPKIDLLVGVDNSGSMSSSANQAALNSNLRNFLTNLNSRGWNYRMTSVPLVPNGADTNLASAIANIPLGTIAASDNTGADIVNPNYYVPPTSYSGFPQANISSSYEPGIAVVAEYANRADVQSVFMRQDAKFISLFISNGDDVSEPLDTSIFPIAPPATVNASFATRLKQSKSTALDPNVRAYSVVNTVGGSCFGISTIATRYINFVSQMLGSSFHLCQPGSVASSALDSIANELDTIKLDYKIGTIFLGQEPNPATIKVFRIRQNGTEEQLAESAINGWQYVGFGSYYQIVAPTNLLLSEGFAIRLFGTAQITGLESARVEYLPKGINPSEGG